MSMPIAVQYKIDVSCEAVIHYCPYMDWLVGDSKLLTLNHSNYQHHHVVDIDTHINSNSFHVSGDVIIIIILIPQSTMIITWMIIKIKKMEIDI